MDDLISGASLKYKSDAILERRKRILRETRNLIAETGYHAFNIRDLCARAGIAQKTLYNAFGSKENVVAAAIHQYIAEFSVNTSLRVSIAPVDGFLEGSVKIHSANMQVRSYTHAIVSVFNSLGPDNYIRRSIREYSRLYNRPFIEEVKRLNCFSPGVSAERFDHMIVTAAFGVTADWCQGEIPDEEFLDRACETMLLVIVGSTRGKINLQAKRWLEDLREGGASWLYLRKLTEASAAPIDLGMDVVANDRRQVSNLRAVGAARLVSAE
jgi:AcrR family transcriptional regulator